MLKYLLFFSLLLMNCYNNKTINIAVKTCNLSFEKVQEQLPVLQEKDATLYLQIKEEDLTNPKLKDILKDANDRGLKIIIWPFLRSEQGPWANDHNYDVYIPLMYKIVDFLKEENVITKYLVVNMENASAQMDTVKEYLKDKDYSSLFDMLLKNINREKFDIAVQEYKKMIDSLHVKGYKVMITTYPYLIDDMQDNDPDIQDLVNVPISGIDWDAYTFTPYRTAYSSDFNVKFSPFIAYEYSRAAREEYKEKARIALGIVGPSGHGPGFTSPEDLYKDISAVKAAGVQEVDLFYLGGMIKEEAEVKDWINSEVEPIIPAFDYKVIAARTFVKSLDYLMNGQEGSKEDILALIEQIQLRHILKWEKDYK